MFRENVIPVSGWKFIGFLCIFTTLLGPKYGLLMLKIRFALSQANHAAVAEKIAAGENVELHVEGRTISSNPAS